MARYLATVPIVRVDDIDGHTSVSLVGDGYDSDAEIADMDIATARCLAFRILDATGGLSGNTREILYGDRRTANARDIVEQNFDRRKHLKLVTPIEVTE